MEASLQNNDLQILFKDLPTAVACFDVDGNAIACSYKLAAILGKSTESIIESHYQQLFPLLKHQISDAFFELLSKNEEQVTFPQMSNEFGGSGSQILDLVFTQKELNEKNVILLSLDELPATNHSENKSSAFASLPNLMDDLLTLVVLMSVDGIVLDANRASLDAIDCSVESVKGKYYWDCQWWSRDVQLQQKIKFVCKKVARGDKVRFDANISGIKSDVIVDLIMKPVTNSEGKVTHLMASATDITSRRKFEDAVRVSQQRFESVTNRTTDGLVIFDKQGQIRFANKGFLSLVDRQLDLTQQNIHHFFKETDEFNEAWQYLESFERSLSMVDLEKIEASRSSFLTLVPTEKKADVVFSHFIDNKEVFYLLTVSDVTDLIDSEAALKKALEEKTILLNEVHHRVKNNLQVMSSMLSLQTSSVDEQHKSPLLDAQRRLKSMALIHELLYENENFAKVLLSIFIEKLKNLIQESMNVDCDIQLLTDMHVDDVYIDMNKMVPLGFLMTELITNAYKHAFDKDSDQNKRIIIGVKSLESDVVEISIMDNGKGILDSTPKGLGSELIKVFVKQLKGSIESKDNQGCTHTITFSPSES